LKYNITVTPHPVEWSRSDKDKAMHHVLSYLGHCSGPVDVTDNDTGETITLKNDSRREMLRLGNMLDFGDEHRAYYKAGLMSDITPKKLMHHVLDHQDRFKEQECVKITRHLLVWLTAAFSRMTPSTEHAADWASQVLNELEGGSLDSLPSINGFNALGAMLKSQENL